MILVRTNLKKIRTERGLSLGKLASQTKLSKTTLSLIESGYSDPRLSTVFKLCKVLNLQVEDIFPFMN